MTFLDQLQVDNNHQKTYGSTADAGVDDGRSSPSSYPERRERRKRESFSDNIGVSYAAARYLMHHLCLRF